VARLDVLQGDRGEVGAEADAGRDDGDGLAAGDEFVLVLDGRHERAVGCRAAVGTRVDAPEGVPDRVGQPGDGFAGDVVEGDGFLAGLLFPFVSFDNPTSSALTQERLGWRPEGPTLIADIEKGHYFSE